MPRRRVRAGDEVALDTNETLAPVLSVAQDFESLIALFDRQMELLPRSDQETRLHVVKARAAAQRGAQLSEKLLEQIRSRK